MRDSRKGRKDRKALGDGAPPKSARAARAEARVVRRAIRAARRARNGEPPDVEAEILQVVFRVATARERAVLQRQFGAAVPRDHTGLEPPPFDDKTRLPPPLDKKEQAAFGRAYFYAIHRGEARVLGEFARFTLRQAHNLERAAEVAERIAERLQDTLSYKLVNGDDAAEREATWAAAGFLLDVLAVEYRELAGQLRKVAAVAASAATERRKRRYKPGTPVGEGGAGNPGGGGGAAPADGGTNAAPAAKAPKGKPRKRG